MSPSSEMGASSPPNPESGFGVGAGVGETVGDGIGVGVEVGASDGFGVGTGFFVGVGCGVGVASGSSGSMSVSGVDVSAGAGVSSASLTGDGSGETACLGISSCAASVTGGDAGAPTARVMTSMLSIPKRNAAAASRITFLIFISANQFSLSGSECSGSSSSENPGDAVIIS